MINPKLRALLFDAARSATSLDAYLSDYALSSVWGDAPDAEIPTERIRFLSTLYEATHTTVPALLAKYNLNATQFAHAFGLLPRTVQRWVAGTAPVSPQLLAALVEIAEYEEL